MAKIAPAPIKAPITDQLGNISRPWVQWFTDNFNRINERIEQITGVIAGNIPITDTDGSLTDSGYGPTTLPYFLETEFIDTSAGAADADKPIILDAGGQVDATMINDADVDHGSIGGLAGDDHVQYHNNTRGDARYLYRENVGVFTPDADYEPATKKYVDDRTAATQADMAASEAHTITDPADNPATVDALRDDLVANTIPDIESKLNALGVEINKVNALIDKLQAAGLMT